MNSEETLNSYENNIQKYVAKSPSVVEGEMKQWLNDFINFLPHEGSHIFEIGSGTGRDAQYLQDNAMNVFCSDATNGFVDLLRDKGFPAFNFNILTDVIPGNQWSGFLANAVLLHFTPAETRLVLQKIYDALADDGVFAFSLKRGKGSVWSAEKLGVPCFFQYWEESEIVFETLKTGFRDVVIFFDKEWIMVNALK